MPMQRRSFLGRTLGSSLALSAGGMALSSGKARAQGAPQPAERLLFVVCAAGGGQITESFLPVADTEVSTPELAATLAVQPASQVRQPDGSNLRCVANRGGSVVGLPPSYPISQELFLQRHAADTVVMTVEGTSVNHRVAQHRSLTGAGIDRGRTILEAAALAYGQDLLLPNVNMATDGYLEPGGDPDVPLRSRGEPVANAALFPFQTHGYRGLGLSTSPSTARLERARSLRDELDQTSAFGRTFAGADKLQTYLARRSDLGRMEELDLIHQLMMVEDDGLHFPLGAYGLEPSPVLELLQETFSDLTVDGFQAQAALAYLLARAGVSNAIAIAPSFQPNFVGAALNNTPLAFDFSHADHRGTQNVMWSRILAAVDGLIRLLKGTPDENGGSLWDRSLVYVATDFGRDKIRPANSSEWGTGHHLNNGVVMVSPLLHGNRVYGGVDPETLLTYGFDPTTGDPAPGTVMREGDVYSVVAQALGIEFEGRRSFPAVVRNA